MEEGKDIDIVFSGLKTGEKILEELFFEDEKVEKTEHEKILVCRNAQPQQLPEYGEVIVSDATLEEIAMAARDGNANAIYRTLNRVVPEYRPPIEAGEYLTQDEFNYQLLAERNEKLSSEQFVEPQGGHSPRP